MKLEFSSFILCITLFLSSNIAFSQIDRNKDADLPDGYLVTKRGKKVECSNVSLAPPYIRYDNSEGEYKTIPQKKVKELRIGNRLFLGLKVTSVATRLQEVVATNKKYVFSVYRESGRWLYIWDRNNFLDTSKPVVKLRLLNSQLSYQEQKDAMKKFYKDEVRSRFKECSELLEMFEENLANLGSENHYYLHSNIYNFTCEGADKL